MISRGSVHVPRIEPVVIAGLSLNTTCICKVKKTVAAHFTSEQLLPSRFAWQAMCILKID